MGLREGKLKGGLLGRWRGVFDTFRGAFIIDRGVLTFEKTFSNYEITDVIWNQRAVYTFMPKVRGRVDIVRESFVALLAGKIFRDWLYMSGSWGTFFRR